MRPVRGLCRFRSGTSGSNPLSSCDESAVRPVISKSTMAFSGGPDSETGSGTRDQCGAPWNAGVQGWTESSNLLCSCGESANSRSRCSAHCSLSNLPTSVKPLKDDPEQVGHRIRNEGAGAITRYAENSRAIAKPAARTADRLLLDRRVTEGICDGASESQRASIFLCTQGHPKKLVGQGSAHNA
jgi:hypothetical protein